MRGDGRRILLLLLDGAADRPASDLDGRTPLEAAETPQLDRLAAAGVSGLADVGAPGIPMPSDRAHARLFGYDPGEIPRRGVLEARGLGVDVADGVTCSGCFAGIEVAPSGWTVADRSLSGARDGCVADAGLIETFETDGVTVEFEYTWKNRGILRLESDAPLDPGVTDTDPFEAGLPVVHPEPTEEADDREGAARTAAALAAYTRWSIDELRNTDRESGVVLSKWAGVPTDPDPFAQSQGMDAASLTSKPVLVGLAKTLGMAVIDTPADYDDRATAAIEALDAFEFVHVHYPEPDVVAHAGTPTEKKRELEAIDASLGGLVDRVLDEDIVTVVTADHTTPSVGNVVHSGEPVPVAMTAPTVRTDDVESVGERPAAAGGMGRIAGMDLLRIARAAGDRVLLDGLRRTPAGGSVPTTDVRPLSTDRGPE